MDPVSQGALGALAAASSADPKRLRLAVGVGWAGGMLADADIFIRSSADPLLNIEYHRHFTHSLVFIPVGGLICAAVLWLVLKRWAGFKELLLYATLGYATAGLLDACTSYGTQLYWPFSNERVAWSIISIIDPVFTGAMLIALGFGFWWRRRKPVWLGLVFVTVYLVFGGVQHYRANEAVIQLAQGRGHLEASRISVKPSIGNLIVWRGIYEIEGGLQVDAIRVGLGGGVSVYEGDRIRGVDRRTLEAELPEGSVLSGDLERFAHFSDDYLGWHPTEPNIIGDARYAMLPDSSVPLWGIEFDPSRPDAHARFVTFREADRSVGSRLWRLIRGLE